MNKLFIFSLIFLSLKLKAQILNGGVFEVPSSDQVDLPIHLKMTKKTFKDDVHNELEKVGLQGRDKKISITMKDFVKIDLLYNTLNKLKNVDSNCAKKHQAKSLLEGQKTLEDVFEHISASHYSVKINEAVNVNNQNFPIDKTQCNCDKNTADVLNCIRGNIELRGQIQQTILDQKDLYLLFDMIYIDKEGVDSEIFKSFFQNFYKDDQ